jgi:hypothetical protein
MNQTSPFILKRALLSVSDKRGLVTRCWMFLNLYVVAIGGLEPPTSAL